MTKTETISYKELKKLMKLSLSIDMELGFYIAVHQRTIIIDKYSNWDSNKTKLYKFSNNDLNDIIRLVNAYATIFKRNLKMH